MRTRGGNKQPGSAAAGSSVQKAEPAAAAVAQAAGADSHLFLLFVYASPSRTTTASWFLFLTESSEWFWKNKLTFLQTVLWEASGLCFLFQETNSLC